MNLKLKFVAFAILTTMTMSINAQTIKIDTTQISFENKLRPAIGALVDPEPNTIKKAWKNYFKKNFNVKVDGFGFLQNKDILKATDVMIAKVSDKRININIRVTETASGSELKVFSSFGYDIFIGQNNYPKEFEATQQILTDFLITTLSSYYNDEIKATTKRIKSLNKDRTKKLKQLNKNDKKIIKLTSEIARLNSLSNSTSESALKATEKLNKKTNEKLKLETSNLELRSNIKIIEEKLPLRNKKLQQLKLKYQNL